MSLREEMSELMRIRNNLESSSMGEPPTSPADIYAWCEEAAQFITAHGQALLDALEDAERAPSNVDDGLSVAYMVGRLDGQVQPSATALIAYVLDNYEGHAATEESMNIWLSECIESAHIRSADQAIDAAIKGDGL